jgi:hypothetical protein
MSDPVLIGDSCNFRKLPTTGLSYFDCLHNGDETVAHVVVMQCEITDTVGLASNPSEMLTGGGMDDKNAWNITYLATTDSLHATWGYLGDGPAAGDGGCLRLTDTATAANNYCIWQQVTLAAHSTYQFDGALKSVLKTTENYWIQPNIGTTAPVTGSDLGATFTQISQFLFWADCKVDSGFDGTFKADACDPGTYYAATAGTYYFALKIGNNSGSHFDFLFDNLSLTLVPDVTPPSVTITSTPVDTVNGKFAIRIAFSESVAGFESSDLTLTNGTIQVLSFVTVSPSVYTDTIVPIAGGDVIIGLPAGACADLNSNDNLAATNLSVFYVVPTAVQNTLASSIEVYPNPVDGVLNFNIPGFSGAAEVNIINMVGSTVYVNTFANPSGTINMSSVKSGAYILKIKTGDKVYVQKLIVK